jgi:hypothetical protein
MGYINQVCSVTNSKKLLISMRARVPAESVPTSGDLLPLLVFGLPTLVNGTATTPANESTATWTVTSSGGENAYADPATYYLDGSYIYYYPNGVGAIIKSDVLAWGSYLLYSGHTAKGILQGGANLYLGAGFDSVDGNGGTFNLDAWNHILLSVDGSQPYTVYDTGGPDRIQVDPASGAYVGMALNDVDLSATLVRTFGGFVGTSPHAAGYPGQTTANLFSGARIRSVFDDSIITGLRFEPQPPVEGEATLPQSVPGFDIGINGLEFGMPSQSIGAAAGENKKIQLADVRIWVGKSLNLSTTSNRRLFINADGSPVPPSAAVAVLGTPTFDQRGPASGIQTNQGTGGDFTKTGTVTDFTPGP